MALRQIPPDRIDDLGNAELGLTSKAVADRRARHGFNDVVVSGRATWITLARDTAGDPMLWFLVGMSVLFAMTGDLAEAALLALAVAPLVGMDAYLHRRTQSSTAALSGRLATQARVVRDGAVVTIPARELTPGDLVDVAVGEPFPADGLLVQGETVQVDESTLTGESWPVRKRPLAFALAAPVQADTVHWLFAGTRLLRGDVRMRVVTIGGESLYGEIVRAAVIGSHDQTPLQKAIGRLVAIMLMGALALCLGLAAIRLSEGYGLIDAILSAATLAIAALPEEFPVVFTFTLGVGVYRLARRKALVRRAVAVENLGRVTCICSDKTGTLTAGRLTLARRRPADGVAEDRLIALAAAVNSGGADPLDAALAAAASASIRFDRLAIFPFTEDRRRETALLLQPTGEHLAAVKGAPETVFGLCGDRPESLEIWRARVADDAGAGHKVIAVATRAVDLNHPLDEEPAGGFSLAGLLSFEDPLRPGVFEAVAACGEAGIRVIMVTGDHEATATAIARQAGIGEGDPSVAAADGLDREGAGPDPWALTRVDVVARAAPAQKLRLVRALRQAGEIVAVTGDGVNDVPALQLADVGIAMGERGAQSARDVAAIVLLDDNFRTIVGAIAEGRQLFRNLQLSFVYILLVHIPLVLSAAAVPLAGHPLLYLPIHVIWLELIIHPTALLAFQAFPTTNGGPSPRKRPRAARFFGPLAWTAIVVSGIGFAGLIFTAFEMASAAGGGEGHARALGVGALIALGAGSTLALGGLRNRTGWITALASLASLVLFVETPKLNGLMGLAPLAWRDWAIVAGTGLLATVAARVVAALLGERP